MESDQVKMYQISKSEQPNNKENVVLRALVGDPNRHKPLVQHSLPTTAASQETTPASMYTLETRYRPIPPKVLPKSKEPRLYYIDSQQAEQTLPPDPPITREEPDTPLPAVLVVPKNMEEEQEPPPIVFLEPKIISQPVFYSIVSAKTLPVHNEQPIPIKQEMPSPILYTITGQPHRPTIDTSASAVNVATPIIDKSPILYSLVGSPRLQVQIQEPVKQVSQIPQQSSSTLYSIVGNPTLTPPITQTNTLDPPPSIQPEKVSSDQPAPILYTVVGETRVPNDIPKENRPPPASIKQHANGGTMYTVVGDPTIPQSMTIPRKIQPLQPQKQQQQQQQQAQIPSLYPLVGKPNSLPEEKTDTRLKPLVRRKAPLPTIVTTRRISRSLERETALEPVTKPVTSVPPIKTKRQPKLKEPTIPKSETTFIPLPERERVPRRKQPRTTPSYSSPERNRKAFQIPQHDPLRPSDYISPYAYHPSKSYHEQTVHPISLPFLANNHSERKSRPPLYEPRHRGPYDPRTPRSLERYPVKPNERPRLWDYESMAQTDADDDDDINGLNSSRKKQHYRRFRPRTPWIPVW